MFTSVTFVARVHSAVARPNPSGSIRFHQVDPLIPRLWLAPRGLVGPCGSSRQARLARMKSKPKSNQSIWPISGIRVAPLDLGHAGRFGSLSVAGTPV